MRVLCVCGQGNSRSPTLASLLRYRGHETLAIGTDTSSPETRQLLGDWCDRAIFTDPLQQAAFPGLADAKRIVWPIDDIYPRPFNKALRETVIRFASQEERLR